MDIENLDKRLRTDTHLIGSLDHCLVLLMNNSCVPWFILVPDTDKKDVCDLDDKQQAGLLSEVNLVSEFVKSFPDVKKLNVASIGNIVSQLHIHIVGRHPGDYCWPGVVWGASGAAPYEKGELDEIKRSFDVYLQKVNGDE